MESFYPDYFDSDTIEFETSKRKYVRLRIILTASLLILITFFSALGFSVHSLVNPKDPMPLNTAQTELLEDTLNQNYPSRTKIVTPLPYKTIPADLFINAESAIIIDKDTGNILFEKNADMLIPPASMTKLVEMYVVFEAVANGEVSLDDTVPLPKESWAVNLPSDASIMFLAQGQSVTLRELLLGLAIASGNDASIAVAKYICKDMESFVERMNKVISDLGLKRTHFVESSGYSEKNITTAREFAAFCRKYIEKFPESIKDYHSQKVLRYPLEKNLPKEQKDQGDSQAVIQYNTNKLLGLLDGCDGLKTGFIYESGYNIALTSERNGRRFISITMKGPGRGSVQGNKFRIQDGMTLMEFAFSRFAPYKGNGKERNYTIGCSGTEYRSIRLVPALDEKFSVPFIAGATPEEAASMIEVTASIPPYINGEIQCGQELGFLNYSLDGKTLRKIPLVADRENKKAGVLFRLWGNIVAKTASLL